VSRYIAKNTKVWVLESEEQKQKHSDTKIPINKSELLRSYHYTKTMFGVWDDYLEDSEFLEVIYEEMVTDLQGTLERVFEYLEIPIQPNASNTRIYKTEHVLKEQLYEILEEAIASGEIDQFKPEKKHLPLVPLL
jgi:LPS sulfotransferase NodH